MSCMPVNVKMVQGVSIFIGLGLSRDIIYELYEISPKVVQLLVFRIDRRQMMHELQLERFSN